MFRIGLGLHVTDLFMGITGYMFSLPPSFPDDPTNPSSLLAMWDITGSDGVTVNDTTAGTEPPPFAKFNGKGKVWNFDGVGDYITLPTKTLVGDFEVSWGQDTIVAGCVTGSVDGSSYIYNDGTNIRISVAGGSFTFNSIPQTDTSFRLTRTGNQVTLTSDSNSQTLTVNLNDFVVESVGSNIITNNLFEGTLWGLDINGETFSAIGSGPTIIGNQGTLGTLTTTSESDFYAEVLDGTGDSATESGMTISDGASQYYDELHTQLIPAGVFIPPLYDSNSLCSAFTVTGAHAPLQYPSPLKQPLSITSVVCCDASLADAFTPSEPVTVVSTEGTAVISSDGTTVTTAGTLFAITLSNGEILDCAEGGGSNLYSRTGNTTFAITTASETDFWSGERPEGNYDPRIANGFWKIDGDDVNYPFSIATSTKGGPWDVFQGKVRETPEMINADAGQGFYTDQLTGYGLEFNRTDLDELGVEKVKNGDFVKWTDPTVPDEWKHTFTPDVNNYVEDNNGGCRLVSDGALVNIEEIIPILTIGLEYEVEIAMRSKTLGAVKLYNAGDIANDIAVGTTNFQFTAIHDALNVVRDNTVNSGVCDVTIDSISVREVNQYQNNNKQYYWSYCKGNGVYTVQLNDGQDAEVTPWFFCDSLKGCGFALVIGSDNDEKVVNGDFDLWTGDNPDGYTVANEDANNYITEHTGGARIVSDNSASLNLSQAVLVIGETYIITVKKSNHIAGLIRLFDGGTALNVPSSDADGTYTVDWVATGTSLFVYRDGTGNTDYVLNSISIRQVKSNTIKPAYFDGAVIDDFNWRTEDDTITVEMATGYTPTNPYMELTIAGLRTVLAYDVGSESYIATGSHVAEDLAIVNYLVANPTEVACVKMNSIPAQTYNVVNDGFNVVDNGDNVTYTGVPE